MNIAQERKLPLAVPERMRKFLHGEIGRLVRDTGATQSEARARYFERLRPLISEELIRQFKPTEEQLNDPNFGFNFELMRAVFGGVQDSLEPALREQALSSRAQRFIEGKNIAGRIRERINEYVPANNGEPSDGSMKIKYSKDAVYMSVSLALSKAELEDAAGVALSAFTGRLRGLYTEMKAGEKRAAPISNWIDEAVLCRILPIFAGKLFEEITKALNDPRVVQIVAKLSGKEAVAMKFSDVQLEKARKNLVKLCIGKKPKRYGELKRVMEEAGAIVFRELVVSAGA